MRTPQNRGTYQVGSSCGCKRPYFQYSLYIPLALESLTITVFGLTYYYNVKMNKETTLGEGRLGNKYQVQPDDYPPYRNP